MLLANYLFTNHTFLIYMHKQDLVFNNLQGLICCKTQPTHQPTTLKKRLIIPYDEKKNMSHYFTPSEVGRHVFLQLIYDLFRLDPGKTLL